MGESLTGRPSVKATILEEIVAETAAEVAERRARTPLEKVERQAQAAPSIRDFKAALQLWSVAAADEALRQRVVPMEAAFGRLAHQLAGISAANTAGSNTIQMGLSLTASQTFSCSIPGVVDRLNINGFVDLGDGCHAC